jgi:hypothetical protein
MTKTRRIMQILDFTVKSKFRNFPPVHRVVGKMGKIFGKKRAETVSFLRFNTYRQRQIQG